jgi:hypothetical protein
MKRPSGEPTELRKVALRVWDKLEARRARTLNDLRKVEREIAAMYPAVSALLSTDKDAA